jgi:hypothetical protein
LSIDDNKSERLNFASTKNIPDYPDFLDVQVKSFQDFSIETKSDERAMKDFITPSWKIFNYRYKK